MRRALPGVNQVAALAGVSTATVDRVLHRRGGVRQATAQRVVQAAGELGYLPADGLAATLAPAPLRVMFLLPRNTSRFLTMLGDMVSYSQDHWAPFHVKCRVETVDSFNPEALAEALLRHGKRYDGIVMMALEHPQVREAVATLAARGVPVVTVSADLGRSQRVGYVGLDNRAAGRTAGYLIGRFIGTREAQVALVAGSLRYAAHQEREAGFLHVLEELFPQLTVVGLREGLDDSEKNYRTTRALLERHPDLAGIYNIGGASDGIARALQECGLQHKLVFIGHGLTPDTRALLIDGSMDAVITQNPLNTITSCVRIFANLRDGRPALLGVEITRSQVIFRENLP